MADALRDKPYAETTGTQMGATTVSDAARGGANAADRAAAEANPEKPRIAGIALDNKPSVGIEKPSVNATQDKEIIQTYIPPRVQGSAAHAPSTTLMEDTVMLMEGTALMGNVLVFDNAPLSGGGVNEKNQLGADILDNKPKGGVYALSSQLA